MYIANAVCFLSYINDLENIIIICNCSGSNLGTGPINYQEFYGLREKSEVDAN